MLQRKKRTKLHFWRRILLFSAGLALSGVWLVFDVLFAPFAEPAASVEVPALVGQAADTLRLSDAFEVALEYRYDKNTPAGVVLSQEPLAGSRRKLTADAPRCRLTLFVSLGEEQLTLPKVLGRDVREVETELRALGFSVKTELVEGAYPEGTVFAVEPREGSHLPVGGSVLLSVSAGVASESVTVPQLLGLSRSEALVQLWLSRLAVAEVIELPAAEEAGTVVRQSHKAGTLVPAGTGVTLYVARDFSKID